MGWARAWRSEERGGQGCLSPADVCKGGVWQGRPRGLLATSWSSLYSHVYRSCLIVVFWVERSPGGRTVLHKGGDLPPQECEAKERMWEDSGLQTSVSIRIICVLITSACFWPSAAEIEPRFRHLYDSLNDSLTGRSLWLHSGKYRPKWLIFSFKNVMVTMKLRDSKRNKWKYRQPNGLKGIRHFHTYRPLLCNRIWVKSWNAELSS